MDNVPALHQGASYREFANTDSVRFDRRVKRGVIRIVAAVFECRGSQDAHGLLLTRLVQALVAGWEKRLPQCSQLLLVPPCYKLNSLPGKLICKGLIS